MSKTDFYIGWMPGAPRSFSSFVRKYLLVIFAVVISLSAIVALSQKKFSTASFEFGRLTQVKGVYFDAPVPLVRVESAKDIFGNVSYLTIPLVGYGKHGAEGILASLEKENGTTFNGHAITIKGTLLYNDGKTLMQIDSNDHPLSAFSKPVVPEPGIEVKDLGIHVVKGEIVDPKCYFGVMKPGEGKVHRDCAIRCILGGIPPVFHVRNAAGESNYFLIVGPNGEKMNEAVRDFVAEPAEIEARLVQYGDWIVMFTNSGKSFHRISYLNLLKDDVVVAQCGPACRK